LARRSKRPIRRVEKPKFNINEKIRASKVRVVGDDLDAVSEEIGETVEVGVYNTHRALSPSKMVPRSRLTSTLEEGLLSSKTVENSSCSS